MDEPGNPDCPPDDRNPPCVGINDIPNAPSRFCAEPQEFAVDGGVGALSAQQYN